MTLRIHSLLHVGFIVNDINQSLRFYCDLLGLEVDSARPNLGYPGAWLVAGNQQIHLMQLPNPDSTKDRPEHGGRDRHVAFSISGINQLIHTLKANDIPFTHSQSGRNAVFFRDPDGNALEFSEPN